MTTRNHIRLVCFDLGGVVLRICRSWSEACLIAGLDMRRGIDPCAAGEEWERLNELYQTGRIDGDAFAAGISEVIGGSYSPAEVGLIHDAFIVGAYEGAADLMDDLHLAGLKTAALSNTCREHWLFMPRFEVIRKIHHRLGSHEIGVRKPDPAAYAEVERRTGCPGASIVFFDDLTENIEAAKARGWRAHQVDPCGCTVTQMREVLSEYVVLPGGTRR